MVSNTLILTVNTMLAALVLGHIVKEGLSRRRLLIISLDGFRWDFVKRLPEDGHIKSRLRNGGVWAPHGMKNVFVTKTFPNHYSLATGLYEESSGIVANSFWVPEYGKVVHLADHADEHLKGLFKGDPIWTTYIKQKKKDLVGCFMWVGCVFEIQGIRLNRTMAYQRDIPWEVRADTVVRWFVHDKVELALLYFPEPDGASHEYGPNSTQTTHRIREADDNIGYLLDQLEFYGQLSSLNIILTADHGFATVIGVTNVMPNDDLFDAMVRKDDFWHIEPKPGKEAATFEYFKQFDHVKLYRKTDLKLHYARTDRIPSLVLLADYGYAIQDTSSGFKYTSKGTHGYNNSISQMWPFFIAHGPAFIKDATAPSNFHSIDVYNVMCRVLGLHPAPNNGSMARAEAILVKAFRGPTTVLGQIVAAPLSENVLVLVGACVGATVFVILIGFAYLVRNRRHVRYSSKHPKRPMVERYSLLRSEPMNGLDDGEDETLIDSSDSEDLGPPVLPKVTTRPSDSGTIAR